MKAIVCFLFLARLFGDIADHLKPAGIKAGVYGMRNIDFIYMINLDERPEKFSQCLDALAPYGIAPFRFSAVNGWELPLEAINDVGVKCQSWMAPGLRGTCFLPERTCEPIAAIGRTYFCDQYFLGSIGIVLSHASVLQDAWDSGYETIWVMEDDIEIIRDPNLLSELIDELDREVGKNGWDILFTDLDTKDKQGQYVPCASFAERPNFVPSDPGRFARIEPIGAAFRRVGARYGAYSMILRKSGVKKILDFLKAHQVFLAYDMDMTLPNGIRLITVLDDVVSTQPRAASDNGTPNYKRECQS